MEIKESENPFRFAAKRFQEMTVLLNSMKNNNQTKLAFQSLPKHMRRRTATQNPKRLPKRLRAAHISQMKKSGTPSKKKRPSRKFLRKPSTLKQEYLRRSNKDRWLETHVWHAKRFHIVRKWGYKIPYSPCDKSFRACYRAASKHCLIQDISFYQVIEVEGPIETLKERFTKICSSKNGPTITAKCFLDGKREGSCFLYKIDQYPKNCIGEISFLWKPNAVMPCVWLSVHPAFYSELFEELISVFELQRDAISDCSTYSNCFLNVHLLQVINLNRFRLTGPLCNQVLSKAFVVKEAISTGDWLNLYSANPDNMTYHINQKQFWDQLCLVNSPAELPPNMVLPLTIEDPRLSRPTRRTKANWNCSLAPSELPLDVPNISQSVIFNFSILKEICTKIMPTYQFCKLRSEHVIVPGERCEFERDLQAVPVLLIQRPGITNSVKKSLGFNSGWDVIVPAGYGTITWLCMIMWGARAGGIREENHLLRECRTEQFLPDTFAAKVEAAARNRMLRETYFRKPCNKRPNYTKLSICSPFESQWNQLVKEWSGQSTDSSFHVIRDRRILESLKTCWKTKSLPLINDNLEQALIPVSVKMENRGSPGDGALICLPSASDVLVYQSNRANRGRGPIHIEPLAKDAKELLRKSAKKKHLQLLARLRRQRCRIKKKLQLTSNKIVKIPRSHTEQIILNQYKKMCEFWLPTEYKSIRNQCSRDTFGFLTQTDFSFTESRVCGIGYITFFGFRELIKQSQQNCSFVLIRGNKSRNYRSGIMEINCD